MPWFLDQWDFQRADHLAAGAVSAEEVFGADMEGRIGDFVSDGADDCGRIGGGVLREGHEGGAEAELPAFFGGAAANDGLKFSLWEINVLAGCGGFVVAFSVGVVAPGGDTGVFFPCHTVAPACVEHVVARCCLGETNGVEADVPEAFQGRWVGNVRARLLRGEWLGGDHDAFEVEWGS